MKAEAGGGFVTLARPSKFDNSLTEPLSSVFFRSCSGESPCLSHCQQTHKVRRYGSLTVWMKIQSALYHVNPETFSFVDIGNMVASPFAHGRLAGPHERHRIHPAPRQHQHTESASMHQSVESMNRRSGREHSVH